MSIGEKLVFLEALEKRIYAPPTFPTPVGAMDLTFVLPLGLFNPVMERFAAHTGDLVPAPATRIPRLPAPPAVFLGEGPPGAAPVSGTRDRDRVPPFADER